MIQLRERKVDACESVKELRKAKLTDVRSKLHELRHLESELEMDLRKCNRELNHRRRHAGSKRWQGESIRIEILYVPGCSNYQPRFERLQAMLASESVKTGIQGIPVTTEVEAKAVLFPGSPTVRVNSEDVEPHQAIVPGLACRLYANRSGIPSEELLRIAISDAKRRE